jgi:hypothetical protein
MVCKGKYCPRRTSRKRIFYPWVVTIGKKKIPLAVGNNILQTKSFAALGSAVSLLFIVTKNCFPYANQYR